MAQDTTKKSTMRNRDMPATPHTTEVVDVAAHAMRGESEDMRMMVAAYKHDGLTKLEVAAIAAMQGILSRRSVTDEREAIFATRLAVLCAHALFSGLEKAEDK